MAIYHKPDYMYRTVADIPFDELSKKGTRCFVFDVDNTLTRQNETKLKKNIVGVLKEAAKYGKVVIATNNSLERPGMFPDGAMVFQPRSFFHYLLFKKPYRRYFATLIQTIGLPAEKIAMIGDKYFYDINPAERLGMVGVLVNPIGKDLWLDEILRMRIRESLALAQFDLKRPK